MKDHFTVMETIRIAYIASQEGDDSFINCLFRCFEIRKYCNDYIDSGGDVEELINILKTIEKEHY